MKNKIYLDYNATAPMLPEVVSSMSELLTKKIPLNPSSPHHFGLLARVMLEELRSKIITDFGLNPAKQNIIFTSGGTESNNQIIQSFKEKGIITCETEHPSLLNAAKESNAMILQVEKNGLISINYLQSLIVQSLQDRTIQKGFLVSIMTANNETGIIQDLATIADLVHYYGGMIHSDASQALGKINITGILDKMDYLTISSHKIGGPVGIGGLIYNKPTPPNKITQGGGQEFNLRPGTESVLLAKGFATAIQMATQNIQQFYQHCLPLTDLIESKISDFGGIVIGSNKNKSNLYQAVKKLPNTAMIIMPGVNNSTQLMHFDLYDIAASNGSACNSGKVENLSHVLIAMHFNEEAAKCAIRVSFGLQTNIEEIESFIDSWRTLYMRHKN